VNDDLRQSYRNATAHALAGFQLLEAALKTYIAAYYLVVRSLLAGRLPFNFSRDEIENSSLERILKVYKRVAQDPELVLRISALVKTRNDIAHRALGLLYDETVNDDFFLEATGEMVALGDKLTALMKEVTEGSQKVMSQLR
jgi:hypothetical protein